MPAESAQVAQYFARVRVGRVWKAIAVYIVNLRASTRDPGNGSSQLRAVNFRATPHPVSISLIFVSFAPRRTTADPGSSRRAIGRVPASVPRREPLPGFTFKEIRKGRPDCGASQTHHKNVKWYTYQPAGRARQVTQFPRGKA